MSWAADFASDLKLGARLARRAPLFAASAIVVLGIGIGATTAVYYVLREVLFRPLPYHEPDRIVQLMSESPAGPNRLASAAQYFVWHTV